MLIWLILAVIHALTVIQEPDLFSLVKESATQSLQEFVFDQIDPSLVASGGVCVHLRHFQATIDKIRPSVNEKDRKLIWLLL